MALAAPRGSSRSLPAPARLLPAPLSGPPRPQPPPPGRSAAGRGAGSGGRSRSGPRPSQRTLGGAAPGRAWRRGALEGSVCPYPLKTAPPPACPGWLGCAEDARKVSVLGGFRRPPARLGVPASARLLGLCPTRMEAEPTAAFKHELQPVLPSPNVLHQAPRWSAPISYAPRFALP